MADKLMRAIVRVQRDTLVAEDQSVNVWHFDGDDSADFHPVSAYHDAVVALLTEFYNAIDGVIYSDFNTSPLLVSIYDMRDPEPREPEHTAEITLTTAGTNGLPAENAICLSYRAAYESGVNPQRRKGRIYLGPITSACLDVATGDMQVSAATRTAITDAASNLAEGLPVAEGFVQMVKWALYSPTTDATASIDDAFHDVIGGWVDNAVDTQRRRGRAATTRTPFGTP